MKLYICFFLVIAFFIPAVSADGVAIFLDDHDRWNLQPETQQLAAINYENGYENLLISVTLDDSIKGNHTVWIFPVPSYPANVTIDILKGYPRYEGEYLERKVQSNMVLISAGSAAYGTFPASLPLLFQARAGRFVTKVQSSEATNSNLEETVIVHQHIEKMGLTNELITAKDGASLKSYIAQKGFDIPAEAAGGIDEYIGKDYSFVVSYVSNSTQFAGDDNRVSTLSGSSDPGFIGVFARFPTDRIYFPLKMTSAYGNRTIPILIYTKDFISPLPDEKIRHQTAVSYYIDEGYFNRYSAEDLAMFFNNPTDFKPVKYTKIRIVAPSTYFTDDLWMDPIPPIDVRIKEVSLDYPALWAVPLFILISMFASFIAGLVFFGLNPANRKIYVLHGLWNCATMIGFVWGTVEYLKIPEATRLRKLGFFILFYAFFVGVYAYIIATLNPFSITPMYWMSGAILVPLFYILFLPSFVIYSLFGSSGGWRTIQILMIITFVLNLLFDIVVIWWVVRKYRKYFF